MNKELIKKAQAILGSLGADGKGRRKRILSNVGATASVALPIAAHLFFKRRGIRLGNLVDKKFSKPRSFISLKDAMRAAYNEHLNYAANGAKFNPLKLDTVNTGSFTDLSRFGWDPAARTGSIHIGVRNFADAHSRGIDAASFWHELGHAHEAYKNPYHNRKFLRGLLEAKIFSKFMPLKYNPKYQEELRAWANAKKLSGGLDFGAERDLALSTYRNAIYGNQAVAGTGALSAALIGSRLNSERKRRAEHGGFW